MTYLRKPNTDSIYLRVRHAISILTGFITRVEAVARAHNESLSFSARVCLDKAIDM